MIWLTIIVIVVLHFAELCNHVVGQSYSVATYIIIKTVNISPGLNVANVCITE